MTNNACRRLIWSDEFEGPAGSPPDPRWWSHEVGGHGWGNREMQTYTREAENASLDGRGNLVIRALRKHTGITSARLTTRSRFEFRHGRLEARVLLPRGEGLWSAVWMLGSDIGEVGWPACGEIDVMENLGAEPHRNFGTIHCPGHSGRGGIGGDHVSPDLPGRFHVFAVDWSPGSIVWSVGGRAYHSVAAEDLGPAWVFDHPFYLVVNLAVGGSLGGPLAASTQFPAELALDYIRVYGDGSAGPSGQAARSEG